MTIPLKDRIFRMGRVGAALGTPERPADAPAAVRRAGMKAEAPTPPGVESALVRSGSTLPLVTATRASGQHPGPPTCQEEVLVGP